ncbi:MAG TPA: sulfurtransferase complex subunit TusB [Marinobacter sp.]|uniref:Sulfurtransferase complex subunit TusB n=2 Tax=root TaxID=1 RepID=A0A831R0I0_9GAMM|nr:sulfurtransferase complex subunit TusB [Marinobacter antarcticus]HDZ39447.1 sulfurtransferase complex subunit TusB [Marinobacter sp.]HEA51776.1 sulfurtransferase complex subunit TusB [Marinobacter antarcticus]
MALIHTLHILNKTPGHARSLQCMDALRPGDALLFTESAVLALATQQHPEIDVPVFVLAPDALARGLGQCPDGVTQVDFPAMVDLTAQAQTVISW